MTKRGTPRRRGGLTLLKAGLALVLLSGGLFLGAAVAAADTSQPATATQLAPNDPVAGNSYYHQICAGCHGANAQGGKFKMGGKFPPNLQHIANRFDEFMGLVERIADTMPYGSHTDVQDARNVAAYLWTLDGRTPPPPGVYDVSQMNQAIQSGTAPPIVAPPTAAPSPVATPTPTSQSSAPTQTTGNASATGQGQTNVSGSPVRAAKYLVASVPTAPTGLNLGEEWDLGLACLGAGLLLQGLGWLRRQQTTSRTGEGGG